MQFVGSFDATLGETHIEIASNCDTDSLPLLRRLQFRGPGVDLAARSLPLALAILTRDYCGDQFELQGHKISSDYAQAIMRVLGRPVGIANVDGATRTISTGEIDVHARRVSDPVPEFTLRPDAIPFEAIDWAGDFVDPATRRSSGFAFGRYHTNAAYFAEQTLVSIAIGLIHGRDNLRRMTVPLPPGKNRSDYEPIIAGLRITGVTLELDEMATEAEAPKQLARRGRAA